MYLKGKNKGSAWLPILLVMTFLLTLGLALTTEVILTLVQSRRASHLLVAQSLAEAGIEKTLWALNRGQTPQTQFSMGTGDVDISVIDVDAATKNIVATGYTPSRDHPKRLMRRVKAKIEPNPNEQGIAFRYALQAGEGGIEVGGSSDIQGNLYSNAGVTFSGGAYRVTGDVMAHTVVTPNPNPRVAGTITQSAPIVPLPEVNVDWWKAKADAGGTTTGNYSPTGAVNLGPQKFSGNFSMSGAGQVVTLTGPLYIQGNLNMSGGTIVLGESFGAKGTVIIVDGTVSISGGAKFLENSQGGNILIVSISTSDTAIGYNGSSSTEGLALYAINGGMNLTGSGEIVATCGKALRISGSGEIRYKSGLANANFSAGPGGSWDITEWQIVYQ